MDYHSFYYDKRFDDFGRKVKKNYVKTTICVDDQSQLIVSYDASFGDINDSKEFKKTLEKMDREIISKFRIIIGDKRYDSEENHIIAKKYGLMAIIAARNKDVPIRRIEGEHRKRMKRHLPEEYNRKQIVEIVHYVIKRKSGSLVRSRIPELSEKEIAMKIIPYNIRRIVVLNDSKIIFIIEDFYRAG